MIRANKEYHQVDIADVWEFEKTVFLEGERDPDFMRKTKEYSEYHIVENGTSFHTISAKRKKYSKWETILIQNYQKAIGNLENEIRLDYFLSRDSYFQYNPSIILDHNCIHFPHFMALKLSQYNDELAELPNFLNYQRHTNGFEDNPSFISFLMPLLIQYKTKLFSEELIEYCTCWSGLETQVIEDEGDIDLDLDFLNTKPHLKTKGIPLERSPFLSQLISGKAIPSRIIENKKKPAKPAVNSSLNSFDTFELATKNISVFLDKNNEMFESILSKLKVNFLVDNSTEIEHFKNVFRNVPIQKKDRIKWIGKNIELNWMVNILLKDLKLIKPMKNTHWYVTLQCFSNKKGKNFEYDQVAKARKGKVNTKETIRNILSQIKVN